MLVTLNFGNKDIKTKTNYKCKNCGNDIWAVYLVTHNHILAKCNKCKIYLHYELIKVVK